MDLGGDMGVRWGSMLFGRIALTGAVGAALLVGVPGAAVADPPEADLAKVPVAVGFGGAVATVDLDATKAGLSVLRRGGNAVDAAVAAAATLGVTEPFSSGIGGGGFFVFYDARTRTVHTIDGREAAPATMRENTFQDAHGDPLPFQQARVSGISVGVPGTLATWQSALDRWGKFSLRRALQPAIDVATRGFVVDATFAQQVSDNLNAFGQFSSTSALYLPNGQPPVPGSVFRNPDLARTYQQIARDGIGALYRGPIGADIVQTVQDPPKSKTPIGTWTFPIAPGTMTLGDLAAYHTRFPAPTHVNYHGLDVYGMPTPSSGGSTVGEALNILDTVDLATLPRAEALHYYLEASALAFADRNRYVGDYTPRSLLDELLSTDFAKQRACLIDPAHALPKPVAPGTPGAGGCAGAAAVQPDSHEQHTTNMTVTDRWGNVVEYTFTIEQTGGNAMVVPGRGFLLNNELTDFNFVPTQGSAPDPNMPAPGKRPRSSMSPTILLDHGRPFLALGSPGGATIITTVLQILLNRLDFGQNLPDAIAAPRASQRNGTTTQAEPAFLALPAVPVLTGLGHVFVSTPEIGAATGIEFLRDGRLLAAAEPVRRGGGSAGVLRTHPLS
jgi:gamma-glutamyltranspeptidase/glutathione hydrolase